jgi:hypothetical protein
MSDHEGHEGKRRRLDSVIPDILKRAVEKSVEKAPDNIRNIVGDLKVPKEIAHLILSQLDETKNGLFRVVAKEIRDFLEHTNVAGELTKVLTTVQFEVNTTIRFSPNDGKSKSSARGATGESGEPLPKPEVKANVTIKRDGERRKKVRGEPTVSASTNESGQVGPQGGGSVPETGDDLQEDPPPDQER